MELDQLMDRISRSSIEDMQDYRYAARLIFNDGCEELYVMQSFDADEVYSRKTAIKVYNVKGQFVISILYYDVPMNIALDLFLSRIDPLALPYTQHWNMFLRELEINDPYLANQCTELCSKFLYVQECAINYTHAHYEPMSCDE